MKLRIAVVADWGCNGGIFFRTYAPIPAVEKPLLYFVVDTERQRSVG